MARPRATRKPQTSIYETDLTEGNEKLAKLLETRAAKASEKSTAEHNFDVVDKEVRAEIAKLDLGIGTIVRIGDFIVSTSKTTGHTVESFEVSPAERLKIKPLKD